MSNVASPSQGVHEAGGPSLEYYHLERLVELVVSPYLGNVLHNRGQLQSGELPITLNVPAVKKKKTFHRYRVSLGAPLFVLS